jgi:hypothetical protein
MKKIRLNVADLDATEVLSRDQLKAVFGGSGNGCGTASEACKDKSDGDSCVSGDSCSPGYCKYAPIAGLICWRT